MCTAAWGLALDPDDEDRCYVHFALERLAALGHRRDVARLVRALLSTPPDDVVQLVSDTHAAALAALTLGDEPWAQRCVAGLLKLAAKSADEDDLEYATTSLLEFRKEQGWLSDAELAALTPRERVTAHCHRAYRAIDAGDLPKARRETREAARFVTSAKDWHSNVVDLFITLKNRRAALQLWQRLPASAKKQYEPDALASLGLTKQALAKATALGRRGLKELVPEEWNLHNATADIARAFRVMQACGARARAKKLVETALARVEDTGADFESRSFASVGAFIDLGQLAFSCLGKARALPLFERALKVPDAATFRPQIVKALIEAGAADEALALVPHLPKSARASATAEALYAARRWPALHQALQAITNPNEASKLAWSFCAD